MRLPTSLASRRLRAVVALTAGLAGATALTPVAPAAHADGTVTLLGHGWGHGRGLGQYGAYGYAVDHGWTSPQILDHFYGGTTAGTAADTLLTVRLMALDGRTTVMVTAGADFTVGPATVYAGGAARFERTGSTWTLTTTTGGCSGTQRFGPWDVGPNPVAQLVADPGDDRSRMLVACDNGTTYRGALQPVLDGATTHVVNRVSREAYLRGVVPRESPASWAGSDGTAPGLAALEAQAVAARSYAAAESRYPYASTCDTTSCQVYGGASGEDFRTDRAVRNTTNVVRRTSSGGISRTEFSSSTGGWSAGGTFPAVEDLGDTRSPNHTWTQDLPTSAIQQAYPSIGNFLSLDITQRNGLGAEGGRVLSLNVVGDHGRVAVTGDSFRLALGLKSDWFTPVTQPKQWEWLLRDTADSGAPQHDFMFGDASTDIPVACDFDGDGKDGVALYRNGQWLIRNSATPGAPEISFSFGAPGWIPVCGDWTGTGKDGIGVYDGSRWFLRNTPTPGQADALISYGWSAARPVVGDWNGDGKDTIGVYAGGRWLLRNVNAPGNPDLVIDYGWDQALPVPGDVTGTGTDTIGVYSGGRWQLRLSNTPGYADRVVDYGTATDAPLRGHWGGPVSGLGVLRKR